MTELSANQIEFQRALVNAEAPRPVGVLGGARESMERMFDIYRRAYLVRLVDSLGVDFPGLKALLGEVEFARLARAYLRAHPSSYRSIRWVGSSLTAFAAGDPSFSGDPWIADMARVDWALAHAFDAPDREPASLADLIGVPAEFWGSLRLDFHPSLTVFSVSTPVADARSALLADETVAIDRSLRRPGTVMTWRFDLELIPRPAGRRSDGPSPDGRGR
jgi:hypothetical protein